MINAQKLSPGLRLLNLRDVRDIFGFVTYEDTREHLKWLGIPIWKYKREVVVPGQAFLPEEEDGKYAPMCKNPKEAVRKVAVVERVLAIAVEMALFAHLLPGGPGIGPPDDVESMTVDSLPEGVKNLPAGDALRCPDYWRMFQQDPHALQLMVALAGQLYGPYEEGIIKRRLEQLGNFLIRRARKTKQKKKKTAPA